MSKVIEELKTSHLHYVVSLKEEVKVHLVQEMIEVAEYTNKQNQTFNKIIETSPCLAI